MTTLKRIALGAAAIVVAAGAYAGAQDQNTSQQPPPFMGRHGGPGGWFAGPGGPMGMLPLLPMRQLQLTAAQRDQIKAIATSHADEWRALADRARQARQALMTAVTADAVNEPLIRQQSAQLAAVEADLAVARAQAYVEASQILTADQKAKLKDLQAQRLDRARF
jgi:protein CpxP